MDWLPFTNRLSIYKYVCLLGSDLNLQFPILCETAVAQKAVAKTRVRRYPSRRVCIFLS